MHTWRVSTRVQPEGVLRTETGNRIWPNTILVLLTGTGIYFLTFRFWSIQNRNFKSLFRFRLNQNRNLDFTGFPAGFTGIYFPKNCVYKGWICNINIHVVFWKLFFPSGSDPGLYFIYHIWFFLTGTGFLKSQLVPVNQNRNSCFRPDNPVPVVQRTNEVPIHRSFPCPTKGLFSPNLFWFDF